MDSHLIFLVKMQVPQSGKFSYISNWEAVSVLFFKEARSVAYLRIGCEKCILGLCGIRSAEPLQKYAARRGC